MITLGRHAVLPIIAASAALLASCVSPVTGQAQPDTSRPSGTVPGDVSTSTEWTIASAPAGRRAYPTARIEPGELPPPPDSYLACDLMSWKALDERVRPTPKLTDPYIWPIKPSKRGSMECRLDNSSPPPAGSPELGEDFIVSLVLWKNMFLLDQKITIAGRQATIAERPDQCTIILDRGDTKLAVVVTNNRFPGQGLESCTLTRKAVEWALGVR